MGLSGFTIEKILGKYGQVGHCTFPLSRKDLGDT